MSYRCQICPAVVARGTPMKRYYSYYPPGHELAGNIRQEVRVCDSCYEKLRAGVDFDSLVGGSDVKKENGNESHTGPEKLTRFDFKTTQKRRLY